LYKRIIQLFFCFLRMGKGIHILSPNTDYDGDYSDIFNMTDLGRWIGKIRSLGLTPGPQRIDLPVIIKQSDFRSVADTSVLISAALKMTLSMDELLSDDHPDMIPDRVKESRGEFECALSRIQAIDALTDVYDSSPPDEEDFDDLLSILELPDLPLPETSEGEAA